MKRSTRLAALVALPCLAALAACATTPPPQPVAATPPPAPPPVAQAAPKPSVESVTIDFTGSSASLSPAALAQLDGAARLYRDAKPEVMIVTGHSDTSGSEFPNVILSAHRAQAVKQALADRGVPDTRLQIVAAGEAEPVPGIPPSRSAVITWR